MLVCVPTCCVLLVVSVKLDCFGLVFENESLDGRHQHAALRMVRSVSCLSLAGFAKSPPTLPVLHVRMCIRTKQLMVICLPLIAWLVDEHACFAIHDLISFLDRVCGCGCRRQSGCAIDCAHSPLSGWLVDFWTQVAGKWIHFHTHTPHTCLVVVRPTTRLTTLTTIKTTRDFSGCSPRLSPIFACTLFCTPMHHHQNTLVLMISGTRQLTTHDHNHTPISEEMLLPRQNGAQLKRTGYI
jgi:hypothetical protein